MNNDKDNKPRILDYRSPDKDDRTDPARVAAGFFASMGISLLGLLAIGVTENAPRFARILVFLLITAGCATFYDHGRRIDQKPGYRGYWVGALMGCILGFVAWSPCGIAYVFKD